MRTTLSLIFALSAVTAVSVARADDSLGDEVSSRPSTSQAGSPDASKEAPPAAVVGSMESVINSFMRLYAFSNPAWRVAKDIKLGIPEDTQLEDGWEKAKHPVYGWYAFRVKTCDMLSPDERRAVVRDPRFPAFLAQQRALADGKAPTLSPALKAAGTGPALVPEAKLLGRAEVAARLMEGTTPLPPPFRFELTAEQLLMPGRMAISIPNPPAP